MSRAAALWNSCDVLLQIALNFWFVFVFLFGWGIVMKFMGRGGRD